MTWTQICLVEETNDLSTHMLALSLLVVHNSHRSGQHNMSELTARKEVASPHLNFVHLDIEAGRDATTLVQTTIQIHNYLSRTMIIDNSDFTNVSYSINFSSHYSPFFCMHWRNFRSTLEQGRTRTWRLPRFSALVIVLRALARTFINMAVLKDS